MSSISRARLLKESEKVIKRLKFSINEYEPLRLRDILEVVAELNKNRYYVKCMSVQKEEENAGFNWQKLMSEFNIGGGIEDKGGSMWLWFDDGIEVQHNGAWGLEIYMRDITVDRFLKFIARIRPYILEDGVGYLRFQDGGAPYIYDPEEERIGKELHNRREERRMEQLENPNSAGKLRANMRRHEKNEKIKQEKGKGPKTP